MPATSAGSRATRSRCAALLSKFDLLVVLGADPVRMSVWSEVEPLPDDARRSSTSACIDWDMGKNFAAEMAVRADVRETLLALTPLLAKLGGERLAARAKASLAELAKSNWTAKRAELAARIEGRGKDNADRPRLARRCRSPRRCRAMPWSSTRASPPAAT